jgi:hypothetical protein
VRGEDAVTIAACYVTREGVVLGADSTASAMLTGGFHYFNYNQKVFEIGEPGAGTLGIATWGLGGLGSQSHRTLLALLHDSFKTKRPTSVTDAASRWIDQVWAVYSTLPPITRCKDLSNKKPFDPVAVPPDPIARTKAEDNEFEQLKRGLVLGFFLGGYLLPKRIPEAFSISFDPLLGKPSPIAFAGWNFAGAPNMIKRLIYGCDDDFKADVLKSGKWTGTPTELDALLTRHRQGERLSGAGGWGTAVLILLSANLVPMRECCFLTNGSQKFLLLRINFSTSQ